MKRVLVTGGSGFIGTNVVEWFCNSGQNVLSIDIRKPQNRKHNKIFKKVDIMDILTLSQVFSDFSPTHVVHLAARTDLHEKRDIEGYSSNIKGVENMVHVIANQPSVERSIFTSTKLVCPTDYMPISDEDYCPNTLYGESKVVGERIVKASTTMGCEWCIVRPTSIWGPWSYLPHIPYGKFFVLIARGLYFHPGIVDPPKSFGYVGNIVFQIAKLLDAPNKIDQKIFYLSDYDSYTIKSWVDKISTRLGTKRVRTIPEPMVHAFASVGDLMKLCGFKEPPFSSSRLRNMRANTSNVPLDPIMAVTGPLPYSLDQGVDETITWLREQGLIK